MSDPISDRPMFFVPLGPRVGIIFFIPKLNKKEDIYLDPLIANDDEVLMINKFIAFTETIFTKDSLIPLKEEELIEVSPFFKKEITEIIKKVEMLI